MTELMDIIEAKERARLEQSDTYLYMVESYREDWKQGPSVMCIVNGGGPDVHPRDAMLFAANVLMPSTEDEFLVTAMDVHGSNLTENPFTKESWQPGEMQMACEMGMCETGEIYDMLMVAITRRSNAKTFTRTVKYHKHNGEDIRWMETMDFNEWDDDGFGMEGRVPDGLRAAVTQPVLSIQLAQEAGVDLPELLEVFGIDDERRILHQILAATKHLLATGSKLSPNGMVWSCIIPARSEEEADVIKRSMAEEGGVRLISKEELEGLGGD